MDVDKKTFEIHANAWRGEVTAGEALGAAGESLAADLAAGDTTKANHTFYDIITHRGCEYNGTWDDISTWPGAISHFVLNDFVLGTLFLPVALVESVAVNVYSTVSSWFPAGYGGGGGSEEIILE